MRSTGEKTFKQIVVVGDGMVGKTCLLQSYTNESYRESYVATVYDKEEFEIVLDGTTLMIKLIDTAGQEDYERVRRLFYNDSDCFILCYDISNRTSYTNIIQKWLPELKSIEKWPVPIVLVATKIDLRDSRQNRAVINTEEGEVLSRRINANRFIECSSKNDINVKETIHEAVRASVNGAMNQNDEEESSNAFNFCCFCCNK